MNSYGRPVSLHVPIRGHGNSEPQLIPQKYSVQLNYNPAYLLAFELQCGGEPYEHVGSEAYR